MEFDNLSEASVAVLTDGDVVTTVRYSSSHTVGDGSGNSYVFVSGSTATVDGGFVVAHDSGRLIAIDSTIANVLKFGAVPGSDCSSAFQSCIDSGRPVFIPWNATAYKVKNLLLGSNLRITSQGIVRGVLASDSIFSQSGSLFDVKISGGYWQSAANVVKHTTDTISNADFNDMEISGITDAAFWFDSVVSCNWVRVKIGNSTGNGWEITGVAQSNNLSWKQCKYSNGSSGYAILANQTGSAPSFNWDVNIWVEDITGVNAFKFTNLYQARWHDCYFEDACRDYLFDIQGPCRHINVEDCTIAVNTNAKSVFKLTGNVDLETKRNNVTLATSWVNANVPATNQDGSTGQRFIEINGGAFTKSSLRNYYSGGTESESDETLSYDIRSGTSYVLHFEEWVYNEMIETVLADLQKMITGSGTDTPQLTADSLALAAVSLMGTGARTITVTVTDEDDTPIENAKVRLTSGAESYIVETNASGVAVLAVDDATWSVAITKAAHTFTPTTLVVDGNKTPTYVMTATVITPSEPGFATGYATVYDETGSPEENVVVKVRCIVPPSGDDDSDGLSLDGSERSATSDSEGYIEFANLFKGATYERKRGTARWGKPFVVPAANTFEIPNWIGSE